MATNVTVSADVDQLTLKRASDVFERSGMSVTDAIRHLITRVAADSELPLGFERPNAETRAAIEELESGKGQRFATPDALFHDLGL